MKKNTLGTDGPVIGRIGLGLMGMSAFYGAPRRTTRARSARSTAPSSLGVTFLDTRGSIDHVEPAMLAAVYTVKVGVVRAVRV